jgi:uncharacterized membrane protein (UPF0127 family)
VTVQDWGAAAERREPWVRRAVWTVLVAGLLAFVVRGADRPADPHLAAGRLAGTGRRPLAGFGEAGFEVTTAEGTVLDWCALLAATEASRERGLMDQVDLRGYDGMVFRFDAPTAAQFYMFHTRIPLSIAFFDQRGTFVSASDMAPCPASDPGACPTFPAAKPFVQAIEVPEGGLGRLGIGPGSRLAVTDGACA